MATLTSKISLNYKDVNLLAQPNLINSRREIPIEGEKIVISAMTSILGPSFIVACSDLPDEYKPTIHVPRDIFQEENLSTLVNINYPTDRIFVGVGSKSIPQKIIDFCKQNNINTLLIDVANGYLDSVKEAVKYYKSLGFVVCTGSVHTKVGFHELADVGCDIVRTGIAPGSVCITKDSTGFTRGTITEIMELYEAKNDLMRKHWSNKILADGGFKTPADIVKAFSAGADYIMSGKLFTEAFECRMHSSDGYGDLNISKNIYFGMASEYGKACFGEDINNKYIEGTFTEIVPKYSLKKIIFSIWEGIRSGVSYSGYNSVSNMIGNGVFERVAP